MQFIIFEVASDMGIKKGDFCSTLSTFLEAWAVIWVRMIIHYLGQYFYLKCADAPVDSVTFKWYKVHIEYTFWNMSTQLAVIIFGTLVNTIMFLFLILVCYLAQKYIHCFPPKFCKLIAWYGLATCLDFVLILIIDMANQDTDGDFFKLYNYY
jgi:hypothetical protein